MPTIFAQIDAGLSGNDLAQRLQGQVGNLGAIGELATGLFQNPPAAIGQLVQAVGGLDLPDTNKLGELPNIISALQSLVPADLGSVTGGLSAGIGSLAAQVDVQIAGQVTAFINSLTALYGLLQMATAGSPAGFGGMGLGGSSLALGEMLPPGASQAVSVTASGQMQAILQAMERFPDPLNVESFLQSLHDLLNINRRALVPTGTLPVVDELVQTLATLLQWRAMDGSQIANHLENTLQLAAAFIDQSLDSAVQPVLDQAASLGGQLDPVALRSVLQAIDQGMQSLAKAVANADLPAINAGLATLQAQAAQLNVVLSGVNASYFSGQADALLARLEEFHAEADNCLCSLLGRLNPQADLSLLATVAARVNAAFSTDEVANFISAYEQFFEWLLSILGQVDLSLIEEPITTAATALQSAVDGLDNLMVEAVTQVSLLFDEVEAAVDEVDTAAIAQAIEQAVTGFQQQVQAQIDALFGPMRQAIASVVEAVESAVGDFDPQDIVEALRSAVQTLTGILSDPQVLSVVNSIRDGLDGIAAQLQGVSFTPAGSVIVGQIEEVTAILQAIDSSLLSTELKLALSAAVELLPDEDDLQEVKADLLAQLDELLASGSATLLVSVQAQPERLLDQVRAYSPLVLVGDALSDPFQQLVGQLQGLSISELLQPVQQALEQLKTTLAQQANPGQFIAPLEQPFAELLALFDDLQPEALIAPLNEAISSVIDALLEALPVDELLDVLDAVLAELQKIVDTVTAMRLLFERVALLLAGFEDPEGQLNAWIDSIIDRLDHVADTTSLEGAFSLVRSAVLSLKAQPVLEGLLTPLQPFIQGLVDLEAQASLTRLIRDKRDFPLADVAVLPEPEKSNVLSFLASFDPLQPATSRPLSDLQRLADRLQAMPAAISAAFDGWDATYHGPNSYLARFVPADTTMPAVKTLLRATIQAEVGQPLAAILQLFPNLSQFVEGFLELFTGFASAIEARLAILVGGPSSFTTIRDSMNELIDTVRGLNLNFLADELNAVFNTVKAKLNAISPAALRAIVETAFNETLDNLDLASLLPMDQITALDNKFAGIVSGLGELDPHALVVEVIQPEFEAAILPFLEPFDLSAAITVAIEQFERLKVELGVELDRIIAAYVAMLDAVPSLEISLDIDVGVDIGF